MLSWRLFASFATLACSHAVVAEEITPKLPTFEQVLDRHVAVTGGQAAYDRIRNIVRKSSIRMAGNLVMQGTEYITRKGDFRCIMSGDLEVGVLDGMPWSRNKQESMILEAGEERGVVLRGAFCFQKANGGVFTHLWSWLELPKSMVSPAMK